MYSGKFLKAFDYLMYHEGSYVNDPNDTGGETKYGI
jgi:lysozyme family protein